MVFLLITILFVVPLIEVALFVAIGGAIGIVPTILLCVASAVLGAIIVRHQGLQTLVRVQEKLSRRELPNAELAEGAALLAAGILLITPGFFTDAIGFILLIPVVRRTIINILGRRFSKQPSGVGAARGANGQYAEQSPGIIIDVEAEEISERPPGNPNSPWRRKL